MVRFISATILGLSALASISKASPTGLPNQNNDLFCLGEYTALGAQIAWNVVVNHDSKYDARGCGAKFLDSFRGHCGYIMDWDCDIGLHDSANMYFHTANTCTSAEITQAVLAATNGSVDLVCETVKREGKCC